METQEGMGSAEKQLEGTALEYLSLIEEIHGKNATLQKALDYLKERNNKEDILKA